MILVLTGFGFCTHQLIVSFGKLQANDHVITKDVNSSEELTFPAVTICNINMMSKVRMEATENGRQAKLFLDKLNMLKYPEVAKEKLDDSFNIEEAVNQCGFDAESLVYSCTWDGKPCSYRNFTTRLSYQYGQCHTFNSGQTGHPLLSSKSNERSRGLALTILIEERKYYGISSYFNSGARIVVHDQNEHPMVETNGMDLMIGHMTTVKLTKKQYNSLEPPYRSACGERNLITSKVYSWNTCLMECSARRVIQKCGCTLLGLPNVTASDLVRYCDPERMMACGIYVNVSSPSVHVDKKDVDGILYPIISETFGNLTFGFSLFLNPLECDCPKPCKEMKYDTKIHSTNFLTSNYFKDLLLLLTRVYKKYAEKDKRYEEELREMMADHEVQELYRTLRKEVLHLSVHFEDLNTYLTSESPSYDINNFGSDVGGYIGLFLGCSVLTVFEFVDLLVMYCFNRQRQKKTYTPNMEKFQHDMDLSPRSASRKNIEDTTTKNEALAAH